MKCLPAAGDRVLATIAGSIPSPETTVVVSYESSPHDSGPAPERAGGSRSDVALGRIRSPFAADSMAPGLTCPRCRAPSPEGAESCARCGFSFLDTCIVSPAGVDAPEGGSARALAAGILPDGEVLPGGAREDESRRPGSTGSDGESAARQPSLVGREVGGKYRVLSRLGEGGFGVVYEVESLLFDEPLRFAMKVLHPELSRSESFRKRFLREVRLSMALAHENVVQVREFGSTEDGLLYFTMDFCEGETLHRVLAHEAVLPLPRALRIARGIGRALMNSHERGIVHRDLKPGNIFVERDSRGRDRVRVGDFGLAKSILPDATPTSTNDGDLTQGGIVGSPRYMSPEQAAGLEVDGRSDLFSLGIILYEMLYGRAPSERQLEAWAEGSVAAPMHSPRQDVPDDVLDILRFTLAAEPDRRLQSAEEFVGALEALPEFEPPSAAESLDGAVTRIDRVGRACLALILAVITGAVFYTSSRVYFDSEGGRGVVDGFLRRYGFQAEYPLSSRASEPLPPAVEEALERRAEAAGGGLPVADDVADYFPLEVGRSYSFRVFRVDSPVTVIRYDIIAREDIAREDLARKASAAPVMAAETVAPNREGGSGETRRGDERPREQYLVRSEPGRQLFYWSHDPAENTISQEFLLPSTETGALDRVQRRILLKLPRDPSVNQESFTNDVAGVITSVTVEPAPPSITIHGETFRGCLKVVEREASGRRTFTRYFQKWVGEVGYFVRDRDSEDRIVYSRVRVNPEEL